MHSRTDAFKLWWWRRLLTVPWTAWRLSKSIPKEINPEYSPEGLMLKLKPQYFGHLMQRTDLLEKTLMLGKIEGRRRGDDRRQDGWMALLTQTHESVQTHVHHLVMPSICQRGRQMDGITESDGHEFEQTPADTETQRSLVCCSLWGHKELDIA